MTSEIKEILSTRSESKTLPEWVEYFDNKYTKKQLADFCDKHKFKYKYLSPEETSKSQSQTTRKYRIDQDYFKTWSRNMAYVYGFWCANGYIYGGKMFDITVNVKDKYILKKIKQELKYEGNLYDQVDNQSARINFSCAEIYRDIQKLGGTERKSFTLHFPESIPDEYLADYLRGFFDGDGCAHVRKNKRINCSFTGASTSFLMQVWEILKEKAKVQGGSYNPKYHTLTFGKKDSILIGEFLYKGNPELYLKRKYDKFAPYLDLN